MLGLARLAVIVGVEVGDMGGEMGTGEDAGAEDARVVRMRIRGPAKRTRR